MENELEKLGWRVHEAEVDLENAQSEMNTVLELMINIDFGFRRKQDLRRG